MTLPDKCKACGERGRFGSTEFCGVYWRSKRAGGAGCTSGAAPAGKSRLEGATARKGGERRQPDKPEEAGDTRAVHPTAVAKGGGSRPERLTRETTERAMPQTVGGAMSPGGRGTGLLRGKRVINATTGEVLERQEGHGPKCTCLYHRQQRA